MSFIVNSFNDDQSKTLHYLFSDGVTSAASLAAAVLRGPSPSVSCDADGTYFDSSSILQAGSSNTARLDHKLSDGTPLGIISEESSTNLCLYSEDLSNAAWVASNMTKGSTSTTDLWGNSTTTAELTASSANGTCLQTVTSASDDYVYTVYMKRQTGTGNIDLTVDNGSTWTTKTLTSDWQRFDVSDPAETNPVVGVRIVTSGDSIFFTASQLEKNRVYPTSYIGPTTAASIARDGVSITHTDMSFLDTAATVEGTFYIRASRFYDQTLSKTILAIAADNNNRFNTEWGGVATPDIFPQVRDAGSFIISLTASGSLANDTEYHVGFAYETDNAAVTHSGNAVVADTSCTFPITSNPTTFYLGRTVNFGQICGHIAEIRWHNVRKPDQHLIDTTT